MELGDNAPSERQFSPEKLYRAAILKSRFADTILKAREKTLDQVGYRTWPLLHCYIFYSIGVFVT